MTIWPNPSPQYDGTLTVWATPSLGVIWYLNVPLPTFLGQNTAKWPLYYFLKLSCHLSSHKWKCHNLLFITEQNPRCLAIKQTGKTGTVYVDFAMYGQNPEHMLWVKWKFYNGPTTCKRGTRKDTNKQLFNCALLPQNK